MNDGTNILSKKGELIQFLRAVKEKELLKDEKHVELRKKLDFLLQKCSASEIDKNRRFA